MDKINSSEIALIIAMLFAIASFIVPHGTPQWCAAIAGFLWYITVVVIRMFKAFER